MALGDLSDSRAILSALEEFDRLGRAAFLERYGFGEAVSYFIHHEGKHYDSKPIVAAAHGYQFGEPLPNRFSGGERTIARLLEELGFTVSQSCCEGGRQRKGTAAHAGPRFSSDHARRLRRPLRRRSRCRRGQPGRAPARFPRGPSAARDPLSHPGPTA
jgi:hypothetical protein